MVLVILRQITVENIEFKNRNGHVVGSWLKRLMI